MTKTSGIDRGQRGFTIIEVLVAITILLIGVLGTVTLIDTANGVTNNTKAREGATNLAREIVEISRSLPYDALTQTNIQGALQAQPGLADANTATTPWEIDRRAGNGSNAIRYTVDVFACTMDDAKDGARVINPNDTTNYCNGSVQAGSTQKVDLNPDDFRRIEVDVKWARPGRPPSSCKGANGAAVGTGLLCVQEATLIPNPTGGLGPSIRSSSVQVFQCTGATATTCDTTALPGNGEVEPPGTGVRIDFDTNQGADGVSFAVNDSIQTTGTATARAGDTTGKQWTLTYVFPPGIVDGTYTVTIQATLLGAQGDPALKPVPVNLSLPGSPDVTNVQPISYGFSTRISPGVVEAAWAPPPDNASDYNGYQLMQAHNNGFNTLPTLCTTSGAPSGLNCASNAGGLDRSVASCTPNQADQNATSCVDDSPPNGGQWNYYLVAVDDHWQRASESPFNCTIKDFNGNTLGTITVDPSLLGTNNRLGCPSRMMPVDIDVLKANNAPTFTADATSPLASGTTTPHISWTATASDTDPGDTVAFYRIYRTSSSAGPPPYSARIGTSNATQQSFDDTSPAAGTSFYWVSAVDSRLQESPAIGPVQWP